MSGQLSKRQQARNERVLQDLIKTVPGNNVCADCQARNPGWASWNLGIFLCMQCAAVHRKLGTHISKVKSLTMDSWSHEQVEIMKRIGNLASNRIYNPQNTKAPINYDANETDASMERFIRQKYQDKVINISQTSSLVKPDYGTDDRPPPLPPKTGTKFGLRSASSILSLSSHYKKETLLQNKLDPRPKLGRNKPSRVFGITVEVADDFDSKNLKLCDMGFLDQEKNMAVLKELGGDLEKSIERLVCIGENNVKGLKQTSNLHESRVISSSIHSERVGAPSNSSSYKIDNFTSSKNFTNPYTPFDPAKSTVQPQSSQSTGVLQYQTMCGISHKQFASDFNDVTPSHSPSTLDQNFQRMSLNRSQSLFPNRTGPGYTAANLSQIELQQKSVTPPVPYLPQHYHSPITFQNSTEQTMQNEKYNPFSNTFQHAFHNEQTNNSNCTNKFLSANIDSNQNTLQNSSTNQGLLVNSQYSTHSSNEVVTSYQNNSNPFFSHMISFVHNVQPQTLHQKVNDISQNNHFQPLQLNSNSATPKLGCKTDSQSILDLYNHPYLAPNRPALEEKNKQYQTTFLSEKNNVNISLSSATTNSNNPFASDISFPASLVQKETTPSQILSRNLSQESLNPNIGEWMNGRHSPDAWRSISARSMR
ncbi:putative uba ts-n domain-containing protein [Erysiphe necator]|uniref:Putative uba ts-n domain-containing protein n=1 Tax=Uncinula necator TaxID=52586 RepID=A0A0B1PBD9_UNCNE|nr:putative uba ts-n domain-containing protein [Erysiphe necator]